MKVFTFALPVIAILGACGSSHDGESDVAAWGSACEDSCAKQEQCNSNTDEPGCTEQCKDRGEAVSAGFANVISDCVNDASCNELINGTTRDCIDDGLQSLPPSVKGKAFCTDSAAKAEECNAATDEPAAVDRCEAGVGLFSDSLLDDLDACLSKSCDQVETCVKDVTDRVNLEQLSGGK